MLIFCQKCGNEFESLSIYIDSKGHKKKYHKKYCSQKCSKSRTFTEEQKQHYRDLYSSGILKLPPAKRDDSKHHLVKCKKCDKEFSKYTKSKQEYCSLSCGRKSDKVGGYRQNSGRAKSGYYNGIYCGSTYELAWVIYRLDHNLPVKRFSTFVQCPITGQRYYPDFIEDNTIFEIKGYERNDAVDIKTKIAESHGYKVVVLRKEDLQTEFNWIIEKYNTKDFKILYDDFKPKYKLCCEYCKKEFLRDVKPRKTISFCTQSCSGKYITNVFRNKNKK